MDNCVTNEPELKATTNATESIATTAAATTLTDIGHRPLDSTITLDNEEEDAQLSDFFDSQIPTMEASLRAFDRDGDGSLNLLEFNGLCHALFRNGERKGYQIPKKKMTELFAAFDVNKDGLIDSKEFNLCWNEWIKKILRPVTALVVVDVQNDFIKGSLSISNCPAKQNGEEVVEPINQLLENVHFDSVFYSLDWHPENHISFIDNIFLRSIHTSSPIQDPDAAQLYDSIIFDGSTPTVQKLWPRHCVQNSWGAKLHENLRIIEASQFIYKGTNPDVDSYSAFWDNSKLAATPLFNQLTAKKVTDVFTCGLAYDVCVGATTLHSLEQGFRTILIEDACRGITLEDMQSTRNKILNQNGLVVNCEEVKGLVHGVDRPFQLGYKLGMEIQKKLSTTFPASN